MEVELKDTLSEFYAMAEWLYQRLNIMKEMIS